MKLVSQKKKTTKLELSHRRGPPGGLPRSHPQRTLDVSWEEEVAAGREQQLWAGTLGSAGRSFSKNGSRPGQDPTP